MSKTLNELLALSGADFVRAAFHVVLRRYPDERGLQDSLTFLALGGSKLVLLASISNSAEARSREALEPWEAKLRQRATLMRIPVLNVLLSVFLGWEGNSGFERQMRRLEFQMTKMVAAGPGPVSEAVSDRSGESRPNTDLAAVKRLPAGARNFYAKLSMMSLIGKN